VSEHGDDGRSRAQRYQQRLSEALQRFESAGDALLTELVNLANARAVAGLGRAAGCRHPYAYRHSLSSRRAVTFRTVAPAKLLDRVGGVLDEVCCMDPAVPEKSQK